MILAADGWPGWHATLWIIVALMGVRTVGMSANRLIHAKEDSINPRTSTRHIPQGILSHKEVLGMILVSGAIFVFASYQLNSLAFWLTPVAIGYVILYSYAKYFTWCCNFMLGWALAMAPAGAWIGVSGTLPMEAVLLSFAVAMWAKPRNKFGPQEIWGIGRSKDSSVDACYFGLCFVSFRYMDGIGIFLLYRLGYNSMFANL